MISDLVWFLLLSSLVTEESPCISELSDGRPTILGYEAIPSFTAPGSCKIYLKDDTAFGLSSYLLLLVCYDFSISLCINLLCDSRSPYVSLVGGFVKSNIFIAPGDSKLGSIELILLCWFLSSILDPSYDLRYSTTRGVFGSSSSSTGSSSIVSSREGISSKMSLFGFGIGRNSCSLSYYILMLIIRF